MSFLGAFLKHLDIVFVIVQRLDDWTTEPQRLLQLKGDRFETRVTLGLCTGAEFISTFNTASREIYDRNVNICGFATRDKLLAESA
jgi:hypothetical protein